MKKDNLIEEIEIELELLETVVKEIILIKQKTEKETPEMMVRAASGTYLMNFYNGIENILKRIHKLQKVDMPKGDNWHTELFNRFCSPGFENLPVLFNSLLENEMIHYKKFRHLFIHGYGFQLEWKFMKEGVDNMEDVFVKFKSIILSFLESIN